MDLKIFLSVILASSQNTATHHSCSNVSVDPRSSYDFVLENHTVVNPSYDLTLEDHLEKIEIDSKRIFPKKVFVNSKWTVWDKITTSDAFKASCKVNETLAMQNLLPLVFGNLSYTEEFIKRIFPENDSDHLFRNSEINQTLTLQHPLSLVGYLSKRQKFVKNDSDHAFRNFAFGLLGLGTVCLISAEQLRKEEERQIQSLWRQYKAKRSLEQLRREQLLRQNEAATKMQSLWRQYKAKRSLEQLRKENEAATKIQSLLRSYLESKSQDGGTSIETFSDDFEIDFFTESEEEDTVINIIDKKIQLAMIGNFLGIDSLDQEGKKSVWEKIYELMKMGKIGFNDSFSIGVSWLKGERPNLHLLSKKHGQIIGASDPLVSVIIASDDTSSDEDENGTGQEDQKRLRDKEILIEHFSTFHTLISDEKIQYQNIEAEEQNIEAEEDLIEEDLIEITEFLSAKIKSREKINAGKQSVKSFKKEILKNIYTKDNCKVVEIIKNLELKYMILLNTKKVLADPVKGAFFFSTLIPKTPEDEALNLFLSLTGLRLSFDKSIGYEKDGKTSQASKHLSSLILQLDDIKKENNGYLMSEDMINAIKAEKEVLR